jgi:hypothetical protein
MSKELEAAIHCVEISLEESLAIFERSWGKPLENGYIASVRAVISAARQTLGREDCSEPFTQADWEALRYRKNTHGEIDTLNNDTLYHNIRGGFSISSSIGEGMDITNEPIAKYKARVLIEILCGKEPTE